MISQTQTNICTDEGEETDVGGLSIFLALTYLFTTECYAAVLTTNVDERDQCSQSRGGLLKRANRSCSATLELTAAKPEDRAIVAIAVKEGQ